jgi:hypothetical protein
LKIKLICTLLLFASHSQAKPLAMTLKELVAEANVICEVSIFKRLRRNLYQISTVACLRGKPRRLFLDKLTDSSKVGVGERYFIFAQSCGKSVTSINGLVGIVPIKKSVALTYYISGEAESVALSGLLKKVENLLLEVEPESASTYWCP